MVATGASPWYHVPHNTEARRADSFSSVLVLRSEALLRRVAMEFNTIRPACGNLRNLCLNQSPLGALLCIGAFFHGLAPVANMNPALHWDPAPTPRVPTFWD